MSEHTPPLPPAPEKRSPTDGRHSTTGPYPDVPGPEVAEAATLPPTAAADTAPAAGPPAGDGGPGQAVLVRAADTAPAAGPPAVPGHEILGELGRGGMGVVYQARQTALDRVVALKMILFGGHAGEEERARFKTEAEAVARMQHPNIVQVFEVGEQNGTPYLSLEFCPAGNLDRKLAGTPLPPREAAALVEKLARAMHHAHQQGVVHRDLKPANVLLAADGTPKITDFGLAKKIDDSAGATRTGAVLGTPSYMAPEQAAGKTKGIGPAVDVYALGAILYECLTGRPPFKAATPLDTLLQVLSEDPVAPRLLQSQTPRDLETVCLKCLRKEPGRRYDSAAELADDLAAFREGRSIRARRPSPPERALRWVKRRQRSVVVAAAAAAVTVLLAGGGQSLRTAYLDAHHGHVMLTADDLFVGELFPADSEEPALPSFTVPTQQPLALPPGLYHLRLSAPERLSESYQLLVEPGREQTFAVGMREQELWPPLEVTTDLAPAGGVWGDLQAVILDRQRGRGPIDLIVLAASEAENAPPGPDGNAPEHRHLELRRVTGRTGKVLWKRGLRKKDQPSLAALADGDWDSILAVLGRSRPVDPAQDPATLVIEQVGSYRGGEKQGGLEEWGVGGAVWFVPAAPDLDGDGVGDLVWAGTSPKGPWLLAVSGKDGSVLWLARAKAAAKELCQPIRQPLVADVDGDGIPDLIVLFDRAFVDLEKREGRGSITLSEITPWVEAFSGRTGRTRWRYEIGPERLRNDGQGALVARGENTLALAREKGRLIVVAGTYRRVVGLDARTGQPAWPVRDLGAPLLGLTNDGRCALVKGDRPAALLSLETGAVLWGSPARPLGTGEGRWRLDDPPALLADLNGDGKPEVLYGGGAIDGATGAPLWGPPPGTSSLRGWLPAADPVVPDLNGDGYADLVVPGWKRVTEFGHPFGRGLIRQETISGQDGRLLASRQHPLDGKFLARSHNSQEPLLRVLAARPPGRPQVAVTYHPETRQGGPVREKWLTALFGADGRLRHAWPGVFEVGTADLDGDGVPDLYGLSRSRSGVRLHACRGGSPEVWRRPGSWRPAVLGGVNLQGLLPYGGLLYLAPPLPEGDLDGDGIPDLLVVHQDEGPPDQAGRGNEATQCSLSTYSGKDGHRLWQVDFRGFREAADEMVPQPRYVACGDLDGAGRPAVVLMYDAVKNGEYHHYRLASLSGTTGTVRWKAPLDGPDGGFRIVDGPGGGGRAVAVANRLFEGRAGRPLQAPAPPLSEGPGYKPLQIPLRDGRWYDIDLNADGPPDRVSFQDGKLLFREGRTGRVLWERLLPDAGPVEVLAVRAGGPGRHPVLGVRTGAHSLHGVDGLSGALLWRCDGTGTPGEVVPDRNPDGPPLVYFHLSGPDVTVCARAVPTAPDGSARPSPDMLPGSPSGDGTWLVPYPWEEEGRAHRAQAVWPALACLGLLLAFALARRWGTAAVLALLLIGLPPLAGTCWGPFSPGGEHHTLIGYLLLWPYTLTAWRVWSFGYDPLLWADDWSRTTAAFQPAGLALNPLAWMAAVAVLVALGQAVRARRSRLVSPTVRELD